MPLLPFITLHDIKCTVKLIISGQIIRKEHAGISMKKCVVSVKWVAHMCTSIVCALFHILFTF